MTRTTASLFSLLLAFGAAAPLAAQARDTSYVPGFDDGVRWGATREQVNAFWREQPLSETRNGAIASLTYLPWQKMNWTARVHDQQGLVGLDAVLLPGLSPVDCQTIYMNLVTAMVESFPGVQGTGGTTLNPGDPLCPAVVAGRARAAHAWLHPATGVEARVWVDSAGFVRLAMSTAFLRGLSGGAAPAGGAPAAAAPAVTVRNAGVTPAGLRGIRPGMSYEQVVEVIGSPGTRTGAAGAGSPTAIYRWGPAGGPAIQVTFINGRALASLQIGLYPRSRVTPITLAAFNRLRQGMTVDEAAAILGTPGSYGGFTDDGSAVSESYLYWGRPLVSFASVAFRAGRLSSMNQGGLN